MNTRWPNATESAAIAAHEAHVWAVPLTQCQCSWEQWWATLVAGERDRADDFRLEAPRRRFVIARGVLRTLLGKYLDAPPAAIEFAGDERGKPRLAPQYAAANLYFNVSHSGDLALIAMAAGCEVGIDVELVRDVIRMEQIARRFFHANEAEALRDTPAADRGAAFLRCWTGKEAVLKAVGTGVTGSLAGFDVPFSESWRGWIELPAPSRIAGHSRCWLQQLTPCDGYVAAVACLESRRSVRCFAYAV